MSLSRLVSTLCVVLFVCGAGFAESAPIYKIEVNDAIHGVTAEFIIETIEAANADGAELVLIQLETPGGLYSATRAIVAAILGSERPVVVYIAPAGARAASAGFLITIAADVAAMAPGTHTGAATPVSGFGGELEDTMRKKVTSDAAADVRSIAEQRGRDGEVAQKAVTETLSWTASEALELGLVNVVARSERELLDALDGTTIDRDGETITLRTSGADVVVREMTRKQRLLSFIANPNVAVLLGLIGLAGLYLEFSNPGALLPGVVGAIAILLAAFAFEILPINVVGLILLAVGFGLLVVEAVTPSFGILGAGGVAGIVIGALLLIEEQPLPAPALRVSWEMVLPVALFLGFIVIFVGRKVVQAQRGTPVTGSDGLLGREATADSPIHGTGKVFIHGEYWDARASEPIAEGERVKVVAVDGLILNVEPVREP